MPPDATTPSPQNPHLSQPITPPTPHSRIRVPFVDGRPPHPDAYHAPRHHNSFSPKSPSLPTHHPISRSGLFWGRFLAFADATALILGLTWLGFAIGLSQVEWQVSLWELLLPHVALLALLLLYGALAALLLSMLLPSRALAASLAGALMVVNYLVNSLARVNEGLDRVLPLHYYQGGWALNGMDWGNLLLLAGLALLFAGLAWLLFLRRDIRVSGEGSWRLP